MSIWTTAYLAYGIEIPTTDEDTLDTALRPLNNEVGHLSAGPYDHGRQYLVTACHDAELGTPETLDLKDSPEQRADWNRQLLAAVAACALSVPVEPAWHLIAAQS